MIDFATSHGWRTGENPARWKGGLANLLPHRKNIAIEHFPAMPYRNVPAFVVELRDIDAISARCLEFMILTAARSGEARGARAPSGFASGKRPRKWRLIQQ